MGFKHNNSLEMKELEIPRIVADTALEAAGSEGGFEMKKQQEMLCVIGTDGSATHYYIDRDKFSMAHRAGDSIILRNFSGEYTFDERNGFDYATLYDGVKFMGVRVKNWHTYFI